MASGHAELSAVGKIQCYRHERRLMRNSEGPRGPRPPLYVGSDAWSQRGRTGRNMSEMVNLHLGCYYSRGSRDVTAGGRHGIGEDVCHGNVGSYALTCMYRLGSSTTMQPP